MGVYDQLLATNADALRTTNQNAMQIAQMPTFADKFLASLRQGNQDNYQHQLGMSQLAMNQAYKQSQEDNMLNQRVQGVLGGLDKTTITSPEQRNAYVRALVGLKRSPEEAEALIPQLGEDGKWSGSTASLNQAKIDRANALIETGKQKADADESLKQAQEEYLSARTDTDRALLQSKVKEAKAKADWAGEMFRSRVQLNDRMPVEAFTGAGGAKGAPLGYRWNGNNLEVVPGGPEDKRRTEGDINNDASTKAVIGTLDDLERQASLVRQHPGLSGNFGVSGKFPNLPGTLTSDAAAQIDTLKSKLFRSTLDSLKEGSKAGNTGVGRVLASEIPMFINNIAPFEKPQSPEQVQQDIDRIIAWTQKTRQRIIESSQNKGSENIRGSVGSTVPMPAPTGPIPAGGSSVRVTQAQPPRLEPEVVRNGKTYILVDGNYYLKPDAGGQ
jgi:hypothetical protein